MFVDQGLEAVFSNPSLVSTLFSPLHEAEPWATAAPDYIYQQLIPIFTQSAVDFDLFIAKTLGNNTWYYLLKNELLKNINCTML